MMLKSAFSSGELGALHASASERFKEVVSNGPSAAGNKISNACIPSGERSILMFAIARWLMSEMGLGAAAIAISGNVHDDIDDLRMHAS